MLPWGPGGKLYKSNKSINQISKDDPIKIQKSLLCQEIDDFL